MPGPPGPNHWLQSDMQRYWFRTPFGETQEYRHGACRAAGTEKYSGKRDKTSDVVRTGATSGWSCRHSRLQTHRSTGRLVGRPGNRSVVPPLTRPKPLCACSTSGGGAFLSLPRCDTLAKSSRAEPRRMASAGGEAPLGTCINEGPGVRGAHDKRWHNDAVSTQSRGVRKGSKKCFSLPGITAHQDNEVESKGGTSLERVAS